MAGAMVVDHHERPSGADRRSRERAWDQAGKERGGGTGAHQQSACSPSREGPGRLRAIVARPIGRSSGSEACRLSQAGYLLAVASQLSKKPVLLTAVVPPYRCGAAPDSHRVPSYDADRFLSRRTDSDHTIWGSVDDVNPIYGASLAKIVPIWHGSAVVRLPSAPMSVNGESAAQGVASRRRDEGSKAFPTPFRRPFP
jgi:hypothetical protein